MSEPASVAGISLPKSTVIVPAALALPVEVTSPGRPLSTFALASPSSSTVTSAALRIWGAESATRVIVAVATSLSQSPSEMRYWKLTERLSCAPGVERSEEHTSELQSLMRISYAGFCLQKKAQNAKITER